MMEPNFSEAFSLDAENGRLLWANPPKNHSEKLGSEAGYICKGKGKNKDYWYVRLDGKTFKRSRVVFFMTEGRWPTPCVDHIDGNSLNDRPSNLREATLSENAQNMRARAGKRSGLPLGVSRYRTGFRAQITIEGARKVLGSFACPEDASRAYQAARKEMFGDFA